MARAAREETDDRVANEAADVLYHLSVLLASRALTLADAGGCSMSAVAESVRGHRDLDRGHRDTGLGVPEAARRRSTASRAFLLESAEHGRVGRYSFIGYRPRKVLRWSLGDPGDPYELAQRELDLTPAERSADLPPFAGGAVGMFAYDLVRTVEPLGEPNPDPLGLPDLALMLTDALVAFDHLKRTITVVAHPDDDAETARAKVAEVREIARRSAAAGRDRSAAGPRIGAARGRVRRRT